MIFNWRYWALTFVGIIAFLLLVGTPDESNPHYWSLFIATKITALALIYADYKVYIWCAENGKIDKIDE